VAFSRRSFIKGLAATSGVGAITGRVSGRQQSAGHVVVVGAGYAGATAAKYIRLWAPAIEVTLVERDSDFVSCPLSNLVLGGSKTLRDITLSYDGLRKHGVKVVRDEIVAGDATNHSVRLASGTTLRYDRLIVAPGVDFMYEELPGLGSPDARARVVHAWKAGTETTILRRQLETMRDGGVFAIHVPLTPYRCPPAPYERACQIAFYFKQSKPKSKVLVLDANEDVQTEKALFVAAWSDLYKGIVEYRPSSGLVDVDPATLTAKLEFEDVKADVLNVVPPQKAARIADLLGLITANNRWCGVNWLTMESTRVSGVHVLGDATLAGPAMPKSGQMANQQAKVCAAAVIALIMNGSINEEPVLDSTCFSFVDDRNAGRIAGRYVYDSAQKTMVQVQGSREVTDRATEVDGSHAMSWAKNIWADMLT
jgi:sulfide dehydrogenase [flavocytochrome c] flavoprotein subunit